MSCPCGLSREELNVHNLVVAQRCTAIYNAENGTEKVCDKLYTAHPSTGKCCFNYKKMRRPVLMPLLMFMMYVVYLFPPLTIFMYVLLVAFWLAQLGKHTNLLDWVFSFANFDFWLFLNLLICVPFLDCDGDIIFLHQLTFPSYKKRRRGRTRSDRWTRCAPRYQRRKHNILAQSLIPFFLVFRVQVSAASHWTLRS